MKPDRTVDLYGLEVEDIEVARQLIEDLLAIELDAHESLYRGGEYYRKELAEGRLWLQPNKDLLWQEGDPLEERWAEPEFSTYPILVYIEGHSDADKIREQLTKNFPRIHFLRGERR